MPGHVLIEHCFNCGLQNAQSTRVKKFEITVPFCNEVKTMAKKSIFLTPKLNNVFELISI